MGQSLPIICRILPGKNPVIFENTGQHHIFASLGFNISTRLSAQERISSQLR
jgi:hypothetical protein